MQAVLNSFDAKVKGAEYSTWLIVLTDLVDLGASKEPAASRAEADKLLDAMNKMGNLNLAIIDSEAISGYQPSHEMWPTWRDNVKRLTNGLSGTNKGWKPAG